MMRPERSSTLPKIFQALAEEGLSPGPWSPPPFPFHRRPRATPRQRTQQPRQQRTPQPPSTVRGIALCVGGSHALVYQPGAPWEPTVSATGKIEFYRNNMTHLHAFLCGDSRVRVVCIGADDASKKLAGSWDLRIVGASDLNGPVERAYGKRSWWSPLGGGSMPQTTAAQR